MSLICGCFILGSGQWRRWAVHWVWLHRPQEETFPKGLNYYKTKTSLSLNSFQLLPCCRKMLLRLNFVKNVRWSCYGFHIKKSSHLIKWNIHGSFHKFPIPWNISANPFLWGRSWDIGTHTFLKVWVLPFHQVPI